MLRVRVFGQLLESDVELPGLPVAESSGDGQLSFWTLRSEPSVSDTPQVHTIDAQPLGQLAYSNGAVVTAATGAAGTEILVSDTGRFTIAHNGRSLTHTGPRGVDLSAVALDLIGVVLPHALHHAGAWCLHASAVQTPSGVIAFVAPRGTGKSTIATACLQAGCALVADDVVVLWPSPQGASVTPTGLPIRLASETAKSVGAAGSTADEWGKVRVGGQSATAEAPLAAVYLLAPVAADADVQRAPREPRAAALALLANGKITELLGAAAIDDVLRRCVALAQVTPVYDLAVPRDLARLPDVTAALLAWHSTDYRTTHRS